MARSFIIFLIVALMTAGNLPKQVQAQLVAEVIGFNPDLAMIELALQRSGLAEMLNDASLPLTVFMPSDAAVQAYMANVGITTEELMSNPSLTNILLSHVVPGIISSAVLQTGDLLPTMLPGASLGIVKNETGMLLVPSGGPAGLVVLPDIEATNGLVYVVDRLLLPAPELIMTTAPPMAEPPAPGL